MNNNIMTTNPTFDETEARVITQDEAIVSMDNDSLLALAEQADKRVDALNRIISAALRITTSKDWVLIGGNPYLQETGASKVARLFGVSWKILGISTETDREGYPTYTYRMAFSMGGNTIECDGSRNAHDDFFAGKKTDKNGNPLKQKTVDEIDLSDVKRAAYTNALNNGIKRMVPGLRNIDVETLEHAGINLGHVGGYTFKTGSQGGNSGKAADSGIVCSACGKPVTQKIASFSQSKFGQILCMNCQKNPPAPSNDDYEEIPPFGDEDAPFLK